ncbi:MAG: hypothetical protein ACPGN3_17455 [Opitutales bacterium]
MKNRLIISIIALPVLILSAQLRAASDLTVNRLRVESTEDADGDDDDGAMIVGNTSGANIAIDPNEIMARNNSTPARLNINAGGGDVRIGDASTTKVGIRTGSPAYALDVVGTIRAEEVIVETGWSDYVFDKGYYLAPLSEVEAHINANGHLPGIPSAANIEANGAKLSELVTLQMAKIEELTLHLIEQQKRAQEQEARIQNLEQQLALK